MKIHYLHLRNKQIPTGGITVAMRVNDSDQVEAFAMAKCHERDNYNRRIGRAKSGGRLNSSKQRFDCVPPKTKDEVVEMVTEAIVRAQTEARPF